MEQLNGKRIMVVDCTGASTTGLCTGCADDRIKMVPDHHSDERVIFLRNVVCYEVVGGGTTGGYCGIKVFVCKNDAINCKGRVLLSQEGSHITDMGCQMIGRTDVKFKCDFMNLGAMEVLPPQVQRTLFNGMTVIREKNKDYLANAKRQIAGNNAESQQ